MERETGLEKEVSHALLGLPDTESESYEHIRKVLNQRD